MGSREVDIDNNRCSFEEDEIVHCQKCGKLFQIGDLDIGKCKCKTTHIDTFKEKPAFPEHYIICAAIKTEDGIVHTGKRHSDCFASIYAKGHNGTYQEFTQGFVDNKWQFKTRDEAFDIAVKANQLQAERNGDTQTLYSEGIY